MAYIDVSGEGLCAPDLVRRVCKPKSDTTASSALSGEAHPAACDPIIHVTDDAHDANV